MFQLLLPDQSVGRLSIFDDAHVHHLTLVVECVSVPNNHDRNRTAPCDLFCQSGLHVFSYGGDNLGTTDMIIVGWCNVCSILFTKA